MIVPSSDYSTIATVVGGPKRHEIEVLDVTVLEHCHYAGPYDNKARCCQVVYSNKTEDLPAVYYVHYRWWQVAIFLDDPERYEDEAMDLPI